MQNTVRKKKKKRTDPDSCCLTGTGFTDRACSRGTDLLAALCKLCAGRCAWARGKLPWQQLPAGAGKSHPALSNPRLPHVPFMYLTLHFAAGVSSRAF